jgi:hypothetical protein
MNERPQAAHAESPEDAAFWDEVVKSPKAMGMLFEHQHCVPDVYQDLFQPVSFPSERRARVAEIDERLQNCKTEEDRRWLQRAKDFLKSYTI